MLNTRAHYIKKYNCDICDYSCSKNSDFIKHLNTNKHIAQKCSFNAHKIDVFACECGKSYKHVQSYNRHKKICGDNNYPITGDTTQTFTPIKSTPLPLDYQAQTNLILELVKQNQEFKQLLIEQNKHLHEKHDDLHKQLLDVAKNSYVNNNTINNTNNSNNKTFNLQFFLNETCKDAMNMSEFIETIEVQMNELENIGHSGYVAGMTDIILSRIKDLDVSKRPVHCTDLKRETMYIKDQNQWNKDTADKSYLRKAISMVSKKNYGKTLEWRERNPECLEIGSSKYDFCFKMMRNVLGDFEDIQVKMDNKIIKSLAKEVVVDR